MAPDDPSDEPPGDPGVATPVDEPRGKDLLTRPREELEERMDPATLAELENWFQQPNLAQREDDDAVVQMVAAEEAEREALRKRREAACAAADPALVRRIESRQSVTLRARPDFELVPIVDETIVNVAVRAQLERQSAEEPVADAREYDQPGDVYDVVHKHNAPQAILRDLFRPVAEWEKRYESPFEELPDMDPAREVRELMRTNHAIIEWAALGYLGGAEAIAEGKARYRLAWPEALEKRRAVEQKKTGS
jgi:hypothetical protein